MSVLVLVEAQAKPEAISDLQSYMTELLPDTRAYDGCQRMDVYANSDDAGNMVVVEHWDSRVHHEKYVAWRTETGVMGRIVAMLTGPPSIRYFERIDV